MYRDEIIQLTGGVNDYVGKLDQTNHPMGEGWYRINEPCIIFTRENPASKQIQNVIVPMKGIPGQEAYRNYVDVRIPDTMAMEIRTLDKEGPMYRLYMQEINRKKSSIILPENGIVTH
jgi:hypothetical protein